MPGEQSYSLTLHGIPGLRSGMVQRPRIEPNRIGDKYVNVMMPNIMLLYLWIGAYPKCHWRAFIQ